MIVICGGLADAITELVCARLESRGLSYRLLNLGLYPSGYKVSWCWNGAPPSGFIRGPDWYVDLDDIASIFVRYPGPEARASISDSAERARFFYGEIDFGLSALLDNLPCVVVNRIAEGMSNHSKPFQALMLREEGLEIAPTLVTDEPEAARQFIEECEGNVIFKSLSGIRSIVQRVTHRHLERLPLLRHGPVQFQRQILGDDIRVHTVGDEVFATLVRSEAVDYRYAGKLGARVLMEPIQIPAAVEEASLRATARLGLVMAGIDFKRTHDGAYVCFEVNPSPGFLYYEQRAGQPISDAVVNVLCGKTTVPAVNAVTFQAKGGSNGRAEENAERGICLK